MAAEDLAFGLQGDRLVSEGVGFHDTAELLRLINELQKRTDDQMRSPFADDYGWHELPRY